MRRVLILGATGSIGTTALNAVREGKLDVKITGLAARHNEDRLKALAEEFDCPYIINDDSGKLDDFISSSDSDIALNGIAGSPGLEASLRCIKHSVDLALANKESVVMGGSFLFESAQKNGSKIIPVDSEHSAIYNLLKGHEDEVEKLVITASGGPFLNRRDLENVTVEEACSHPTWKMGRKISIDSSTLANKGLEVIEAGFLFNMPAEKIEVTIHRQSVVHSMIRLENGAVYAQLSPPDMTLPIINALNDGHQELHNVVKPLSFENLTLTFSSWDRNQFPLLALAYNVLSSKAAYPIAFNAADEVAVAAFIEGRIRYTQIAEIVERVLDHDWTASAHSFEEIKHYDSLARERAASCLASF